MRRKRRCCPWRRTECRTERRPAFRPSPRRVGERALLRIPWRRRGRRSIARPHPPHALAQAHPPRPRSPIAHPGEHRSSTIAHRCVARVASFAVLVRREAWYDEEAVAHLWAERFRRFIERDGRPVVGTQSHLVAEGAELADTARLHPIEHVHVLENRVELLRQLLYVRIVETEARERGDTAYVIDADA